MTAATTVSASRDATLTNRDRRAIDLIVAGMTQEEIAKRLGMHRKTLWRRRKTPEFARALAEAEEEARRAQLRTIGNLARHAAGYLGRVMSDATQPVETRVRAAGILLSRWAQLQPREVDIDARVTALNGDLMGHDEAREDLRDRLAGIRMRHESLRAPLALPSSNGHSSNGHGNGHEER